MKTDVRRDWDWSDGYLPEIKRILARNAFKLFSVDVASEHQDLKRATDMVLKISGDDLEIAVRLRRPKYSYRDLTLRAVRSSGVQTELVKIQRGFGDFYLYGWTQGMLIPEWMLVDLNKLRDCGLLEWKRDVISNTDGQTGFIAVPYMQLQAYGCVVTSQISLPATG